MTRRVTYKPNKIPARWREILLNIPGYDSIKTAGPDRFFDATTAQVALDFFPSCLKHAEGGLKGKPFVIERWQQAFVANLMGWMQRDEFGRIVRRYRETLLYVSRKNGKTPIVSGLGLLVFFTDQEPGQQDFIAASDKEQAGLLFRQMRSMIESEPAMEKRCKIYGGNATAGQSKSIVRENDNSYIRVISADASGKHGGNTHLAIIDELHEQKSRDLVDVLQTSFASVNRAQPLFVCVTTADFDRPSICNEKYEYACKVRDGVIDDPRYLPVIYELPRDADWKDESLWHLANPNLGVSVSMDYLRAEARRALEVPAYEFTFRRLHLDQRTTSISKCIPLEQWDACYDDGIELAALAERDCCVALDIGATSDFCAMARLFPHDDMEIVSDPWKVTDASDGEDGNHTIARRSYTLLMDFWLPSEPVRRDPRMQAQIEAWRASGLIRTTPGNAVDYEVMFSDITKILEPHGISGFLFDKGFEGLGIGQKLSQHYGDIVQWFPQVITKMNGPFREMLNLLAFGRLHHTGHPVMRWMVSNVVAEERQGMLKPSKDKSAEKIDGVTALVMAIALGSKNDANSWFEANGGLRG